MPHAAHVLVAAADDADRGRLAVMLADNGYRVSAAASGSTTVSMVRELNPDVVVLGSSINDTELSDLTQNVKAADDSEAVRVVVVAPQLSDTVRGRCVTAGADDVVEGPFNRNVVLARMKPLCRLSTMRAELRRRAETAKSLGIDVTADPLFAANSNGHCKVMVVARPGGMTERAVRSALDTGFNLTVESDPYRAGSVVESERYDAMVVAADGRREAAEPMLYLSSHLRNNPSLFNLPVMMLHGQDLFEDGGDPYRYGASMALGLPLEKAALASGLNVLVRRQRQRWALREAFRGLFHAVCPGKTEEVFPESFVLPHLKTLVADADRDGRHLSIGIFSLNNLADVKRKYFAEAGEMLMAKMANWITGLVRCEDMVGRLGSDELCVILPDTAQEECTAMVHRIGAILSASEFNLTEEVMHPVRVWVDGGCASLAPGDTPETLLQRARATLF